jgi:hypothetical protein
VFKILILSNGLWISTSPRLVAGDAGERSPQGFRRRLARLPATSGLSFEMIFFSNTSF